LGASGVRCFWRCKSDRVVTPEVAVALTGLRVDERALVLVELVNRQEFDCGYAERFQVRDFLGQSRERSRMRDARGGMAGEAADVQLIDNRFLMRHERRRVVAPIVSRATVVETPPRCAMALVFGALTPYSTVRQERRRGVE